MTVRPAPSRRSHASQRGLTLPELLLTIVIMAVGFVALVGAFANTEKTIGSSADVAQLTSFEGAVGTLIQSESFAYVVCSGPSGQAPSGSTPYLTSIQTLVSTDSVSETGYPDAVTAIAVTQASSRSASIPVDATCATAGTGSGKDYGLQQISYTVADTKTGQTLTGVVYKRWN